MIKYITLFTQLFTLLGTVTAMLPALWALPEIICYPVSIALMGFPHILGEEIIERYENS